MFAVWANERSKRPHGLLKTRIQNVTQEKGERRKEKLETGKIKEEKKEIRRSTPVTRPDTQQPKSCVGGQGR